VHDGYFLDIKKYPCGKTILFQKTGKQIEEYIIVHLGSGDGQQHKRLPMRHAERIIEFINDHYPQMPVILTGLGNEAELTTSLCNKINSPHVLDTANKLSLRELIGVIALLLYLFQATAGPCILHPF
jgi:ADP-heptose:LPS heptosyltransferase